MMTSLQLSHILGPWACFNSCWRRNIHRSETTLKPLTAKVNYSAYLLQLNVQLGEPTFQRSHGCYHDTCWRKVFLDHIYRSVRMILLLLLLLCLPPPPSVLFKGQPACTRFFFSFPLSQLFRSVDPKYLKSFISAPYGLTAPPWFL